MALWTLLAGPSRPARVLAIDSGTVYLQVDPMVDPRDGRDHPGAVLALLAPGAARLPIGMELPAVAASLVPVSVAGSPVGRGEITVGWGAITVAGRRWPVLTWWNPGIPALPRPAESIAAAGAADRPEAEPPGLADPAPGPARPGVADLAPGLGNGLGNGLAALAAGDAVAAVGQLIGVGEGFVPPGDEVLIGALAALAAWAPDSAARPELASAVAAAVTGTSLVSAALLQSAAAGFAVPELIDYLTYLSSVVGTVDPVAGGSPAALGVDGQLRALRRDGAQRVF